MAQPDRCSVCKTEAPPADTSYTLISLGWRLTRTPIRGGGFLFKWHCPGCWAKTKEGREEEAKARAAKAR